MLKKLKTWILPHSCLLCGNKDCGLQDICAPCFTELPHLTYACPVCARPFIDIQQNLLCGACLQQAPPFHSTLALYLYQPPLNKLIMDLKFGQSLVNARVLGEQLAERVLQDESYHKTRPQVIIPMPLHPRRLQERGFNQAVELSRPLATRLRLPLELNLCRRVKLTTPQATLTAKERRENIKNAFYVPSRLPFQHVAVVDDVITTGFTVTEFSWALRKCGVERIDIWCCARALL